VKIEDRGLRLVEKGQVYSRGSIFLYRETNYDNALARLAI